MQGISWDSKELKKNYILFRLDEMNKNGNKLLEIVSIIYGITLVEAYFNGTPTKIILYLFALLLSLFIYKNMQIIGEKANKKKIEKQFNLQDETLIQQAYDNFSFSTRALSVDFNMQFINRFDEKKQSQLITDKLGIEAKSSLMNLGQIKTSNNMNDLLSDAPRFGSMNQQQVSNVPSSEALDDLLLDSSPAKRYQKVSPGNLQNSSGPNTQMHIIVEPLENSNLQNRQQSTFSFTRVKQQLAEKRIKRLISWPLKKLILMLKKKSNHDIQFPVALFMIELIRNSVYSQLPQQICMITSCILFYQQTETVIENISLFIMTLGTIYIGMKRLKYLEEFEFNTFENSHMLQSFLKSLQMFIRENPSNQSGNCGGFTLLEDLKAYRKNISTQNRNINLASESREYFTIQKDPKKQNSKLEIRKYFMVFMSKIIYEGKICLLLTMRDVTNQKVIQEKKLVDEVKNRIFKSFTHELKNPLNFLLFSFELINKHISDLRTSPTALKNLKSVVSTADSCANILRNIINDFIDYSMLCSVNGNLQLNKKDLDLSELITRIEKIMINQLKSQNVAFRVSRDPDLPKIIYSDPEKLEQILLNLLLNAQKFTQKGWIKFKIQKQKLKKHSSHSGEQSLDITQNFNQNNTNVFNGLGVSCNNLLGNISQSSIQDEYFIRFMVLDTGNGIEKERVQTIFNLFEQNQSGMVKESQQNKKSAGLGLTISQNLCLALGGQIRCKSEIGKGSMFYFDIKYTLEKDQIDKRQPTMNELTFQNNMNVNRSIIDEDKIEENEAVYMYKTQIGKFNTTFDQSDNEDMNEGDDLLLQPNSLQLFSNKNTMSQTALAQANLLGIQTIAEQQSESSANLSFQQKPNKENRRGSDQNQSLSNQLLDPSQMTLLGQRQNSNSIKTAQFNDEEEKRAKKLENMQNNNLKFKQIIQNDNLYSFTGLKDLVSNPDLFELNFREEENIVQIKWSKNNKTNQLVLTQNKDDKIALSQRNQNLNDESRQFLATNNLTSNNYHHKTQLGNLMDTAQNFHTAQVNSYSITDKSSQNKESFNETALKESLVQLHQEQNRAALQKIKQDNQILKSVGQINLLQVANGSDDFIQESKSSAYHQMKESQLNSQRSMDSLDEHIRIDVIGDYAKLLGRDRHSNENSNYFVQKRKLIHTQVSTNMEPKATSQIKNPFSLFDETIKNEFELIKSSRRSNSVSNTVILNTQNNRQSRNHTRNVSGCDCKSSNQTPSISLSRNYDMRQMKISIPLTGGIQITQRMLSHIPSIKESSRDSARQQMIENYSQKYQKASEKHKSHEDYEDGEEIANIINKRRDNEIHKDFNSMALAHNNNDMRQLIENIDERQSEINKLNEFLGDESLYNHPMAQDSQPFNQVQQINRHDSSLQNNQLTEPQQNSAPSILNLKNFCCPEIMVVDDIDYNRYILVQIISSLFDLDCIQACNGQDCIDQVKLLDKKTCCDGLKLIIMDYEMPILNGLEASRQMVQMMSNGILKKKIPIVALTAYNDEKAKCLAVGMKRFLTKPAKSAELRQILNEILTGKI
eukprot:403361468